MSAPCAGRMQPSHRCSWSACSSSSRRGSPQTSRGDAILLTGDGVLRDRRARGRNATAARRNWREHSRVRHRQCAGGGVAHPLRHGARRQAAGGARPGSSTLSDTLRERAGRGRHLRSDRTPLCKTSRWCRQSPVLPSSVTCYTRWIALPRSWSRVDRRRYCLSGRADPGVEEAGRNRIVI
jgi:hypothetical protein